MSLSFVPSRWLPSERSKLTTLSPDILLLVLDSVSPVDRVCLALACKYLAGIVVAAPKLTPQQWMHSDVQYSRRTLKPYVLLPRLAYGWLSRYRFGYCSLCCKVLSRDKHYWTWYWVRCRVTKNRLHWAPFLVIPRYDWELMSQFAQHEHLVERWAKAWETEELHKHCKHCWRNDCFHQRTHCPACTVQALTYLSSYGQYYGTIAAQAEGICRNVYKAARSCGVAVFGITGPSTKVMEADSPLTNTSKFEHSTH